MIGNKLGMKSGTPTLIIRTAQEKDVDDIIELGQKVYPTMGSYKKSMILGQLNHFPQGQFIAQYEGKIVGYCSTFLIDRERALESHTWSEITGRGHASSHDPNGEVLYGLDIFVDPDCRGMRIGQRLYRARKKLCQSLKLKGIVFVGRIPGFAKKRKKFPTVDEYVKAVQEKSIRDSTLSFQLKNGFEVIGIVEDYLQKDLESLGYGVHLMWKNPDLEQQSTKGKPYGLREPATIRIGAVQYLQRRVTSFEEFKQIVRYFVDVVSNYEGDFIVFPELFTLQLLSIEPNTLSPTQAVDALTKYTPLFKQFMQDLAIRFNINIIGGSHPTRIDEKTIKNICYVFLRDGSIHQQEKVHPTPNEKYWWNIKGGDEANVIQTDCGPIGILICYDSEFPELARHLINQGAKILFVPFCTDERQSYLRVRYCCQSRAVENQCYVVLSGNVGNLPNVENMDIQYAQSCILTPCDFPFARDGIAADTTPNVEAVAVADLRMDSLIKARNQGTVLNLKNRRNDLYEVIWKK
ncbi:MAG: GNAT family N-acetyltransferase [Bdellovibrionota bacterium]